MNLGRWINASEFDQLNNYYITKELENVGRCDALTSQHLPLSRAKEGSEQENENGSKRKWFPVCQRWESFKRRSTNKCIMTCSNTGVHKPRTLGRPGELHFVRLGLKNCGLSLWKLLHVTLLVPRILRGPSTFLEKLLYPCAYHKYIHSCVRTHVHT